MYLFKTRTHNYLRGHIDKIDSFIGKLSCKMCSYGTPQLLHECVKPQKVDIIWKTKNESTIIYQPTSHDLLLRLIKGTSLGEDSYYDKDGKLGTAGILTSSMLKKALFVVEFNYDLFIANNDF